jgi:hypothetical protein
MNTVQKHIYSHYHSPSSEPFRVIYVLPPLVRKIFEILFTFCFNLFVSVLYILFVFSEEQVI